MSRVAADFILVLHFLFVLFVLFGALSALSRWQFVFLHLPAALWGAFVEFANFPCPLTWLENHFRHSAGGYRASFIEHYLMPLLYPGTLGRTTQFVLGATVIVINTLLYAGVYLRWRR